MRSKTEKTGGAFLLNIVQALTSDNPKADHSLPKQSSGQLCHLRGDWPQGGLPGIVDSL